MVEFFFIFLKRYVLRHKILTCNNVFPIFIGLAIVVSPTGNMRNFTWPVTMNMLLWSSPFQGIGVPWIFWAALSIEYANDEVICKNQLNACCDNGKNSH